MISIIKKPTTIAVVITASTMALAVAPVCVNTNSKAFAWDYHWWWYHYLHHLYHHHNNKSNYADQDIDQSQKSRQHSQCVSGVDVTVSCNNVEFQNEVNSGNNALGQK